MIGVKKVQPIKLSAADFQRQVRKLMQDKRPVAVADHALQMMAKRGVVRKQVDLCLSKGRVIEGPALNIHGNWKAKLTYESAGQDIEVVVALELNKRLIVITVIKPKKNKRK